MTISWGRPDALQLLWLLPVLALFSMWAWRRRRTLLARLGPLAPLRTSRGALRVHGNRLVLWLMGLTLGVVALAQPRWGYRYKELKREGLDIVVVLDVSQSMAATDVSPDRMERARREVLDLTDLLAGDRVGLVIFAGGAYARTPLTLDYGVVRHQVRDSTYDTLLAQGSDIGAALSMAGELLGPQGTADRAVLLITDGEDHVGEARAVAETLAADGVHVYTIGVGTEDGAPIPDSRSGGGFKKDGAGKMVLSRLDTELLQDLARIGKGAYVRSGGSNRDVAAIYNGEIRGKLQGAEQGVRRERIWDERFVWPLGLSLLCFAAAALVRPGPLRLPGAALVLWVAVSLAMPQSAAAQSTASQLAEQQARSPDDLDLAERLGLALLAEGQPRRAHEVLSSVADRTLDPDQRTRARYNAGHAAYRAGQLTRAAEDWQRVVESSDNHDGANQNLGLVQQEIARRLQQQPPEQSPQDGEPSDGQDTQPSDGQDAPPQDGSDDNPTPPDDGSQPQQPPDSDGENSPQDGQQQPQDSPPQDSPPQDGTRQEPDPATDTGLPGERGELRPADEGDPTQDTGAPTDAAPTATQAPRPGEMSPTEAARMLDAVEEGSPQVVARPGRAGDKDW